MADAIWAASGIRIPALSAKEREHLAVLRVTVLAADPTEARLSSRRVDLLTLLTVVDRLTEGPWVESVMVVDKATAGAFFAGSMRVYQGHWRFRFGARRKSGQRGEVG